MKGFVIAGSRSGIGKTTISMGLMSVFDKVSPFKIGPDYIDTTFHKFATNNKSYNLDIFMMGEEGVQYSFYKHSKGLSIVEGVMGFFDGLGTDLNNYSTAHISKLLKLPVILVVDGQRIGSSISAEVLGYKCLDSEVNIKGVIINRVNSEKVYRLLKESIERYTGIECLGYLPNNPELAISSRHLGLLQADEVERLEEKKEILKSEIGKTVNLERILEIAELGEREYRGNIFSNLKKKYKGLKIGIAKDKVFTFYYEDNIELLQYLGFEIIEFSPLFDKRIPEVDILYFGGGYPENYAKELSENREFIESLKEFYENDGLIYGECGGFIYLCDEIELLDNKKIKLASLFDIKIKMRDKLDISRFGYVEIEVDGIKGKGHEFHYSQIVEDNNNRKIYKIKKYDGREWGCGYSSKNLIAGYSHLHLYKNIRLFEKFLNKKNREM